jgi:hypothetical protein
MGGVAERHRREVTRLLKRLPDELPRTRGKAWRELRDLMERRRTEAEAERTPVRTTLRALPRPQPEAEPTAAPAPSPGHTESIHPAGIPGLTALAPLAGPISSTDPDHAAPPSQSSQGE